jgi:hypothetical protein
MTTKHKAEVLADELIEFARHVAHITGANSKLRQQQAEIEALKSTGKPVAELVLEQMAVGDASSLRVNWLIDGYPPAGTKLYTHPAKTLTDEEILEELLIPKSEWDSYKAHHCLKQIRAILKKASEK